MHSKEVRRERRRRSWHYARRAKHVHLSLAHPDGAPDCACERSTWYFEKRKALGCDCRKRRRGQPKIGRGCHGWRDAVAQRTAGRRLASAWLRALDRRAADDVEL
jgi:hypothetical protein